MKIKSLILLTAFLAALGCGGSWSDSDGGHRSGIVVQCLDVNNGTITCTTPIQSIDPVGKIYWTVFTHNPIVDPALAVNLHSDIYNSTGGAFYGTMIIDYSYTPTGGLPTYYSTSQALTLQPQEVVSINLVLAAPGFAAGRGSATMRILKSDGALESPAVVGFQIQ